MGFPLIPTSRILNDLERRNSLHFAFFLNRIRQIFRPIISQWLKIDLWCPQNIVFQFQSSTFGENYNVIEVGTNRNPVCDFLLVINSNWYPISYRFGVIAACCWNFAPTRSHWLKISGTRGRLPPIIFARIVRPMNSLLLCRWPFSHK